MITLATNWDGEFVSFEQTTSEVFWTTLPQGFGFALVVWLFSVSVSVCFKIVKQG